MNRFTTPLDTRQIDEDTFELLHRLIYKNDKFLITVYKGFDFDGASIPRFFWTLIGSPTTGRYTKPACLHDALYASKIFDKKTCDNLFLEAMKAENVGFITRTLIYNAVRVGGFMAYNNSQDLSKYRSLIKVSKLNQRGGIKCLVYG